MRELTMKINMSFEIDDSTRALVAKRLTGGPGKRLATRAEVRDTVNQLWRDWLDNSTVSAGREYTDMDKQEALAALGGFTKVDIPYHSGASLWERTRRDTGEKERIAIYQNGRVEAQPV